MTWLRAVLVRLGWRGGLDRLKRNIDEELLFHLEMKVASNLRAGMNEAEVRTDARRRLGDVDDIHSEGAMILAGAQAAPKRSGFFFAIHQDIRTAIRHIRRSPGYAISVCGVLALGLAASTTVFTYLRSYQQPFPGADSNGLIQVFNRSETDAYGELSYADYLDLTRVDGSGFSEVAADQSGFAASVRFEGGGTEVLFGQAVTGSYFSVLDIDMSLGRPILPDDDRPDAVPTVVISHAYWRTRFNANPDVVGKTLYLNNNPYTVIGIAGPAFRGSSAATRPDAWLPFEEYKRVYWARSQIEVSRDIAVMRVYVRLDEEGRLEQTEAELRALAAGLDASVPLESGTRSFFVAPATWIHPRQRLAEATVNRVMLTAAAEKWH